MSFTIAILDIANELKKFDFAIERMKKVVPELRGDKDIYEALGIAQSTFATWKKRQTMQQQALINFCIKYKVNMNWFFAGIGQPMLEQGELEFEEPEQQTKLEDVIKQAMVNILPQMERANLPITDDSLHKMVKTYLKFKDRKGTDIATLLSAVAEIEADG